MEIACEGEMYVEDMIEESIMTQIEGLDNLEQGSEEHSAAVRDICDMEKIIIESNRVKMDALNREAELNAKIEQEKKAEKSKTINTVIQTTLQVAGLILPMWFYGKMFATGLQFEEKGTFASSTFRNFLKGIKPTKIG